MRALYLKATLRPDFAFSDNEPNTKEVVGRMSCDIVLIRDAMIEKVGKFIQLITTVIGGFIIAFLKGWVLTLVLLPIPFLVAFSIFIPIIISKTARGKNVHANVVEETIGSIRTVASFSGEKQAIIKYKEVLKHAYKSSVLEGLVSKLGFAIVMLVMFSSYSLAVWRGSKLILHNGYTGGDVLNVIMAVLTGSMSLGQVSTCISAFAACKAFGFKMFETIERKPGIGAYIPKGTILNYIHGDIELKDVNFSYPARPNEPFVNKGSQSLSRVSSFSVSAFGWPIEATVTDDGLEETKENVPKAPIRRIAYLSKPEILILLLGAIVAVINGIILPLFGMLLARLINSFYEPHHKLKKDLSFWSVVFVILGVLSFLAILAQGYLFAVAECKLIARIKLMCFEKLVNMEVGWFDEPAHSSGTIGARLSADAATVGALVGDTLGQIVHVIASAVVGLVIAFLGSWELALVIIIGLIFVIGFNIYIQLMYKEGSKVVMPRKAGIRQSLIAGIIFGTYFGLLFLVYAASFYVGAQLVKLKKATFSDVFQVFFALTMTAMGVSRASTLSTDIGKAMKAFGSLFEIVDQKSKIDPSDDEFGMKFNYLMGRIELCHVYFPCPCGPNTPIFRDLSLLIRPGESVALAGERGNGISMVLALLQRIYDPDAGRIKFDGFDIKGYNTNWLRHQMILLTGELVLFNQSIYDNIAYGKGGNHATLEEVKNAAVLAEADIFITGLQKGYDTVVGDCGVQLSREQKQQLAIARAIVRNPKILLVDEATSAVDAVYESVVQEALVRVMVNRTTVIVAHGLPTIKNVDVIAAIKNGVVVEKGKHDTLIENKDGFYASLVGALHTSASSTA